MQYKTWQGARNSFRHVISLFINIDAILKCNALWSSQGKKNTIEKPLLLEEYTMRKNIAIGIALLEWVYQFSKHFVLLLCTYGILNCK